MLGTKYIHYINRNRSLHIHSIKLISNLNSTREQEVNNRMKCFEESRWTFLRKTKKADRVISRLFEINTRLVTTRQPNIRHLDYLAKILPRFSKVLQVLGRLSKKSKIESKILSRYPICNPKSYGEIHNRFQEFLSNM